MQRPVPGVHRQHPDISFDPSARLAFASGLDSVTQRVLRRQRSLQLLYEGRVASLERYVAFCVMFHAMAKASSRPWLCKPWDVARSQSNLRVATTGMRSTWDTQPAQLKSYTFYDCVVPIACPIPASGAQHGEVSAEVKRTIRTFGRLLRGFEVNF